MSGNHLRYQLEICVDSSEGIAAAVGGGADRIELCSALSIGGLTPTAGLVAAARSATRAAGVELFAMVRPRGGDFAYSPGELALAIEESRHLIAAGVDGLVFGAAIGGQIDEYTSNLWMEAVREIAGRRLPATFHRAIDTVDEPVAAVDRVAAMGFDRILTSGGAPSAFEGISTIGAMRARATAKLSIIAGAGVTSDNAEALISGSGVRALHASASASGSAPDARLVELGFANAAQQITSEDKVRALRSILDDFQTDL